MAHVEIEAKGVRARIDLLFGMISELVVERDGRKVSMLHKVPWLGEKMPEDAAPHLGGLAGDFFCAPFGDASADNAPGHGWPANTTWIASRDGAEGQRDGCALPARPQGDGRRPRQGTAARRRPPLPLPAPHLHRRPCRGHVGRQPRDGFAAEWRPAELLAKTLVGDAADHRSSPIRRAGARCSRARSRPPIPSIFRSPPAARPTSHNYPFASRHEDFAIGVEAEGSRLGWTTVARGKEGDLFISLRNPARLPMTMLWFSNGGRDYAPWSGRHVGCLGVEEGLNRKMLGDSAGRTPHPLDAAGVPTGLTLDPSGSVEVRHIIGQVPWNGDVSISSVTPVEEGIEVRAASGTQTIPCDPTFLQA